jgi:two-component system, NtrC family, nitrogen regulation sensor histidine kinase NtrY
MQGLPTGAFEQWPRKIAVVIRRRRWLPRVELAVFLILLLASIVTYLILSRGQPGQQLLTPPFVAVLLVGNLIPAIGLIVLLGRRIAKAKAAKSPMGGSGRLHVRLVALFSMIASIPVLMMVIFASLLFQYGVEFWYSDRARTMFENANTMAQTFYAEKQGRIVKETELMASDLAFNLQVAPIDSKGFNENFAYQVYMRELSEAAIVRFTPKNGSQSLALVNPYDRPTDNWVPKSVVSQLRATKHTVFQDGGGRMQAITPLPGNPDVYVYAARVSDPQTLAQTKRFSLVLKNYDDLVQRSRRLQLQFNAALLAVTLLIVGLAVWVALNVADRLVKPVGELVDAARRVTAGDLSARVASTGSRDEVGLLTNAFNRMTGRLEAQRRELVEASDLIDRRRAFIEAVLTGVTAGVIAISEDGVVRIMNRSAMDLLETDNAAGKHLADFAPELDALVKAREREAIVQLPAAGETMTLAVKVSQDEMGHVLTFDDITAQLTDQRRAAWADVARRIAHEIKNPLTPIQLAAERLKRRFAKEIQTDPVTFERLTDTIIRQVGDLRRMVDEFSSFARMPKPVFREEALIDICRQAVFLHEVAHPAIHFTIDVDDPAIRLLCDRRQLGQALTNIIKNGIEAIEEQGEMATGKIDVHASKDSSDVVTMSVSDNGIGLPQERDRLAEPYMTTRARGTGLGLAIVKKIVEEHGGHLTFSDQAGGGTLVTMRFDPNADVEQFDDADTGSELALAEISPSTLTRKGTR